MGTSTPSPFSGHFSQTVQNKLDQVTITTTQQKQQQGVNQLNQVIIPDTGYLLFSL